MGTIVLLFVPSHLSVYNNIFKRLFGKNAFTSVESLIISWPQGRITPGYRSFDTATLSLASQIFSIYFPTPAMVEKIDYCV